MTSECWGRTAFHPFNLTINFCSFCSFFFHFFLRTEHGIPGGIQHQHHQNLQKTETLQTQETVCDGRNSAWHQFSCSSWSRQQQHHRRCCSQQPEFSHRWITFSSKLYPNDYDGPIIYGDTSSNGAAFGLIQVDKGLVAVAVVVPNVVKDLKCHTFTTQLWVE